jgi:hypothetical protein
VELVPGGSETIRSRLVPSFAAANRSDAFVLLDGDRRREVKDPQDVAANKLKTEVESALNVANASGVVFANTGGPTEDQLKKLLTWIRQYVDYLPGMQPDKWLREKLGETCTIADEKQWWRERTIKNLGKIGSEDVTSQEILDEQKRALVSLDDNDVDLVSIRTAIERVLGGATS